MRLSNEKENKNLVKKMLNAVKIYVFHIQGTFMGKIRTKVMGKYKLVLQSLIWKFKYLLGTSMGETL